MTGKTKSTRNDSGQSTYIRKAEARLREKRAVLNSLKKKLRSTAAQGKIEASESIRKAENQADTYLDAAQERLENLKLANEDSWEELRDGIENAWEDLSQSLKNIMRRL